MEFIFLYIICLREFLVVLNFFLCKTYCIHAELYKCSFLNFMNRLMICFLSKKYFLFYYRIFYPCFVFFPRSVNTVIFQQDGVHLIMPSLFVSIKCKCKTNIDVENENESFEIYSFNAHYLLIQCNRIIKAE